MSNYLIMSFCILKFNLFMNGEIMQQFLACDIGFGSTKVKSANSNFKFPSAVAMRKKSQASISNDDTYHYEGHDYLVGDSATRDALTTRDYTFLEKYAPLLLFKAIVDAKLNPSKEINLATGLSLLNWNKKEAFAEKLVDFIIDKTHVKNVNIQVIPQGKGIFVNALEIMPEINNQLVLVVDIGYNTLDVIPFENGKALAHEAWATPQGMNLIVDELRKDINSSHGVAISEARINKIMQDGCIFVDGEEKDLKVLIENEQQRYKEIIINELQTRNSDLYKSAHKIILAGGGSYFLKDQMFQKNIIFADSPLEFANVNGYWSILKNEA